MQFCEQLLETVEVGFTAKWSSWSKQNCVYRGTRFFTMLLKMFFFNLAHDGKQASGK